MRIGLYDALQGCLKVAANDGCPLNIPTNCVIDYETLFESVGQRYLKYEPLFPNWRETNNSLITSVRSLDKNYVITRFSNTLNVFCGKCLGNSVSVNQKHF